MKRLIAILALAGVFTVQGYAVEESLECKVSAFYYRGNTYTQPMQTADIYQVKEDPMRSEVMLFGETMLRSSKHKFT